jgi:hypothetical protein
MLAPGPSFVRQHPPVPPRWQSEVEEKMADWMNPAAPVGRTFFDVMFQCHCCAALEVLHGASTRSFEELGSAAACKHPLPSLAAIVDSELLGVAPGTDREVTVHPIGSDPHAPK